MNILVYNDISLAADHVAGNVNAFLAVLEWLAREHRVVLLHTHYRRPTRPLPPGVELHWHPALDNLVARHWRERTGRTRRLLDHKRSASKQRHFDRLLRRERFDAVVIEYLDNAFLLDSPALDPGVLRICDLHDLMHERAASFQAHGVVTRENLRITQAEEMTAIARFDRVLVLQRGEADRIDQAVGRRVSLVTRRTQVAPPARLAADRPLDAVRIGFLGTTTDFNVDAAHRLLADFRIDDPAVSYRVAGAVCSRLATNELPPRTTLVGPVDELATFYADIDILANPVRFGSGLKTKNVEALAHGVPVVTTRLGAEGLEDIEGRALLVGDTPAAFADAIAAWRRTAAAGPLRSRVARVWQEAFSPAASFAALQAFLATGRGADPRCK